MQKILLSHGGGGEEMNELINKTIFKTFDNEILRQSNDSALLGEFGGELAFSTDSYVVTPIFFSGGDIGKIAVCGTINDLCMVGAKPLYLSCSLILEEGFSTGELNSVLTSMAQTANECGVKIVCGDTKVVPKGKCDKIFINTSGIGKVICKNISISNIKPGAKILLSGDIGRHGSVVFAARDEISLQSNLQSDCKALDGVVMEILLAGIHPQCMRDATRGGLSAVLNEFADFCGVEILVYEDNIMVTNEVRGLCELMGFEPYDLANEGTFVAIVEAKDEQKTLEILKKFDSNAACIGEVISADGSRVILQNPYGSQRFLEPPKGELLPRIC